jgi:serine/threonine protein kinase
MEKAPSTWHFRGNQRFAVRRQLGAGGMGEVYEAYDRESRQTVALKTLTRYDGATLYRFKREFRALADVTHPNLVSLYELVGEGNSWFFTMELVHGINFLEYVRGAGPAAGAPTSVVGAASTTMVSDRHPTAAMEDAANAPAERDVPLVPCPHPDRLRAALRQLGEGLRALHEIGRLHRDIKPSNVLVTDEGRVVLLDFGLVTESITHGTHHSLVVAGTPAYMSPEQGAGDELSEASDWYSVGVMLYEALTGRLPFTGGYLEVLNDKLHHDPVPPAAVTADVPADLDALCRDLLRRDPAQRPSGAAILQRLGRTPTEPGLPLPPTPSGPDAPFVGRDEPLAVLRDAFATCREGRTMTVYVHGPSGIGKTTLVRQFLEDLARRKQAVVLAGRCYERESVPYKALDGIVDSLTRYLLSLPRAKADAFMPRDALMLSRLFPVMLRVESVAEAPHRDREIPDLPEVRRRAFAALADLLARLADRRPLVLYIDDLQWSDADSLAFLEDLLRLADPAPLLLVASFRSEEIEAKPFLKSLLARAGGERRRALQVGSLTPPAARDLALSLLSPETAVSPDFVETVVREAAGSPFLVEQLTRYALASGGTAAAGVTLAEMLEARMGLLPPGARALLETLAVAARPMDARLAHQAAGEEADAEADERPLLAALRAAHLVRTAGAAPQIELYHDRIRETVTSLLAPDAIRQIHQRLAATFEARGLDDPEALFEHYLGAGDRGRAARYASLAARKASDALAFDRASLLYRRALELSPPTGTDRLELRIGLAEALANAGECAEAARHYLDAAGDADAGRSLEFRRRAAEQLLVSGHIDEGLSVMRTVLAAVGMNLPASPRRALLSMLFRRARLKLRGLGFVERSARDVPERDLLRVDVCWAVSVGLALVDIIRAADSQSRYLLLALQAGEPGRIARAFAVEAGFAASPGRRGRKRAEFFSGKAESLARKVGTPHAIGLARLMTGITGYCNGEWRQCAALCEEAEVILREQCTGTSWEVTSALSFLLRSLIYMGRVGEVTRRLPALLVAAIARGNLYAATELRTRTNLVWLAADDPEGAHRELTEAMRQWSHGSFHRQHYSSLLARADIALYRDDREAAWNQVTSEWPALARSLLLRIHVLRVEAKHLRARCALAMAVGAPDPRPWLRSAERLAGEIERERMAWSDPLALLLRAGVAGVHGDAIAGATLLAQAAERFDAAEMGLHAAAARRRLGQVRGGAEGGRLVAEADAWMQGEGIRKPELIARMLAPGWSQ